MHLKWRDVRTSKDLRRFARIALVLVLLGGIAFAATVALLVEEVGWGALLLVFFIGAVLFAAPAVIGGILVHQATENERQLRALINVRPLYGPFPLLLGASALDPVVADTLVHLLLQERPRQVLECGSGSSTVLIAECLRQLGSGSILSLDHEEFFAERTRQLLAQRNLGRWAEVITAPLQPRDVDGVSHPWYASGFEERLSEPIDFLVVDGPPGNVAPHARLPAIPLLSPHLSQYCMILLDDGNRPAEEAIARDWARKLSGSLRYVPGGKGAWVIRRNGRNARWV